jgi:hypothetical protein
MITSAQCSAKYGPPSDKNSNMILWDVPENLEIGLIPKRVYCNKDMVVPLSHAFNNLIQRDLVKEIVTWDGCFNIRKKRGGSTMSLHSWGVAVDLNAYANCFGCKPKLTAKFVKCFTDAGFDWGGTWSKPDGMHFQLSKI